jgi:hypothetical protein
VCSQCGSVLAIDQRYCLNCGTPRAEPRLDYQRALGPDDPRSPARGAPPAGGIQWSPLLVILAIAALGVMLLLGVLIGKDDNSVTVTEVPASTSTTTTPTAAEPTTPAPTTTTPPPTTTEALPDSTVPPEGGADAGAGAGGIASPGGTD